MSEISSHSIIGELVAENPARARVLEQYGIDFCCGGRKSLENACRDRGVEPAALLKSLSVVDASGTPGAERNWSRAGLGELADHIVQTHHQYLKTELPRLFGLVEKVTRVHGGDHPELFRVATIFEAFRSDMESHMMKEEKVLFPMCRQLETAVRRPTFHCGSLGNPIGVMEAEHEVAGRQLQEMHTLTDGFTPPEGACNTYRVMLAGLEQLEKDTHQHVHLENNILFPRAAEMDAALPV